MTQVTGIPYRRHGPSAALRQFLDRLDPGDYFDCGRARLHGLDDALVEEARQRGLDVGDDAFVLVATDTGLVFCRPSISYAITARWDEITVTRPRGEDPVVLPIRWPRHGELKFTVSRRLAANVFRRWLQLRVRADRQSRECITTLQPCPLATTGPIGPGLGPGRGPELRPGLDADAEVTGEPAMGRLVARALADEADGLLGDGELRRVPKPTGGIGPPSWVGSAVSVAATVVVLSTLVLLASLSAGLYRRVSGGAGEPGAAVAAGAAGRTTVDHQRFLATTSTGMPASAAGGASQVDSTSNQQLLAIPRDAGATDPLSPLGPGAGTGAGAVRCSSHYGGCVPDPSDLVGVDADVDCPGHGDGPWFADGEVAVLGRDVYDLDADGDGRACEVDEGEPVDGGDRPAGPASTRSPLSGVGS